MTDRYEEIGEVALWANKEKSGRQPDVRGHLEINGHKYPISLWKSTSDHPDSPAYWGKCQRDTENQPPISGNENYQAPPSNKPAPQQQQAPEDDFDDDIPF